MSRQAFPVLFINLSGEMMYILDQRLKAQNISKEKSIKVISDIVSTMFNEQFIEELFKPQDIYSKRALRTVFEKLAHSSIMRLNGASMDKLFDLMTMVMKYQLCLCPRPDDILFLTLNHLDGIRKYTETTPDILKLVDNVYTLFFKVSVLLKEGSQRSNGKFALPRGGSVPYGFKMPGTIRSYAPDGRIIDTSSFLTENEYEPPEPPGELTKDGYRGTVLGTNIYSGDGSAKIQASASTLSSQGTAESIQQRETRAKEELSFLARLIGQNELQSLPSEFTLGIFDEGASAFTSQEVTERHSEVVNIDVSQRMEQNTLHKIMGELTIEEKEFDNNDILDLLDVASM